MRRHLLRRQRYAGRAGGLACWHRRQTSAIAGAYRYPAHQVGQRKGGGSVTAVSSSQKGIQRGVLSDAHNLAIAESPALRRKIAGKKFYDTDELIHIEKEKKEKMRKRCLRPSAKAMKTTKVWATGLVLSPGASETKRPAIPNKGVPVETSISSLAYQTILLRKKRRQSMSNFA
jgi:hypothetical protein